MHIARTIAELKRLRPLLGNCVGLVPTLGGLHEGHLALIRAAQQDNEATLTTIFLNPRQFNETADLAYYPRNVEQDLQILEGAGVDLVFAPDVAEIYPADFQTEVRVPRLAKIWEGASRRGHFHSVATIVTILLILAEASQAYFGQKDVQQLTVIRRLVRDLRIATDITVIPTVRAADGLALSTRNERLSPSERLSASRIYRALRTTALALQNDSLNAAALREAMWDQLVTTPLIQVDYAELVDCETLEVIEEPISKEETVLAIVAAQIGDVRLLDNMLFPACLNNRDDLTRLFGVRW